MKFRIIAVGRMKVGPEQALYEHYAARVKPAITLKEVEEQRPLSSAELKAREAELLLAQVPKGATIVLLDETGTSLGSAGFAQKLGGWRDRGVADLALLIGGADGHGEAARAAADFTLSLGAMTWPHMLVRALAAEQLYRAQQILAGHPYHRE